MISDYDCECFLRQVTGNLPKANEFTRWVPSPGHSIRSLKKLNLKLLWIKILFPDPQIKIMTKKLWSGTTPFNFLLV